MKILLATDAWEPQVCGVVRTLQATLKELESQGHEVELLHPGLFTNFPLPLYPEIRWSYGITTRRIQQVFERFQPDAVHVMTEGPIGWAVRNYCVARQLPFTTCFLTKFAEYLNQMCWAPIWLGNWYLRTFHGPASRVLVATPTMQTYLQQAGFTNTTALWPKGVDTDLFVPRAKPTRARPKCLYVGRVSVEKNMEAFLQCDLDVDLQVVGDGPALPSYERAYPRVEFLGYRFGAELAQCYAEADVLVFPSRTDTFGLVIIEALACGLPVAAYPVPGPQDILGGQTGVGCLHADLNMAIRRALLESDPQKCRELALSYNWAASTRQFLSQLAPVN